MRLDLQFGWGMMEHSRQLAIEWSGGTVILSPRDLNAKQLQNTAEKITRVPGGSVLLDPQFFLPRADHARLLSHSYWPKDYATGVFFDGAPLTELLSNLRDLNDELSTSEFILPGLLAQRIDDDWLSVQRAILESARSLDIDKPLCQTIALSADACRDDDQVELLLEHSAAHKAESYYLVCEHPKGSYLVEDGNWVANVVDIIAGLKLGGARVIVGYSNHQMLIASVAKADAIASGTWMNLRSFPPEKFNAPYEEDRKQRAVWYYCPQTLSEYKIFVLDLARKVGLLDVLSPTDEMNDTYVRSLFSGAQPSAVDLSESDAFRHYLSSLNRQVADSVKPTFDETVDYHEGLLNTAKELLAELASKKINGQLRDFAQAVDANRMALAVIQETRGPLLRRYWATLK
jgi:hypothetical protein